jgi:putative transposase
VVEVWLSILVRKLLRGANVSAADNLRNKVPDCFAECNRTMAEPFTWTFLGKPLHV